MKRIMLPAVLLAGWLVFLSIDIPVEENFLPALGRFVSPFEGIWQNAVPRSTKSNFTAAIKGRVHILFDERDVPHIYAENLEDALYAQGFLHASNRLFAMDISTRAASGRLSEIIGPRTIAHDHTQREKGFEWSAIQKAKRWQSFKENQDLIDAYVRGVNDYITTLAYKDWPLEYKILSHGPVTWTSTHTSLMLTNMAIMLCLAEQDLTYTKAKSLLPSDVFEFLYPESNPLESPVIPSEKKWDFIPVVPTSIRSGQVKEKIKTNITDEISQDRNGSNNWAISADKTANGFPLLANDPHLGLTLPNIWYEMEIHTPEMSVHGVSIPGLPFMVIGFNEHIAWGTTNSGQDVLDWYKITWRDSTRKEYLLDGKYQKAILQTEEIKIRGQKAIIDTVRYTHWGPVRSIGDHKDMAMKWVGHIRAEENDVAYLQKINKANNLADYREAIEAFQYPAQNKIFASVDGDIAISVAGVMPLRSSEAGHYIMDGNSTLNDWQGIIPFTHAPFIVNPKRKFVSSANQAPTDRTYPYALKGGRIFEDYRGRTLNMILDTIENVTVEDMKQIQQNNYNLHAAEILPVMLATVKNNNCLKEEERIYAATLEGWNYAQHRDSIAPILFELWFNEFEKMTFDELDSLDVMHPEKWRISEMIIDSSENIFFDVVSTVDKNETFEDIACKSFSYMVKTFLALDGEDRKNWGSFKATEIPHLARFAPFGIPYMHTSGGKHILNAMGKTHGPSWRMIVELSSPPKAYVNYPGGQSGDPASPHYHDLLDQFFEGKYYEVSLRKNPEGWNPAREMIIQPK